MNDKRTHIENQILVMDAQDGCARAMDVLVKRWQQPLWQYAYRLTTDEHAAWDITQQAWIGIIKGLPRLHDPASFKAWAYRITTNKANGWLKKELKRHQVPWESLETIPAQIHEDSELGELVLFLNSKQKAVLILYYYEQLTIPEISIALKIPPGTVKSRLHAARQALKKRYEIEQLR